MCVYVVIYVHNYVHVLMPIYVYIHVYESICIYTCMYLQIYPQNARKVGERIQNSSGLMSLRFDERDYALVLEGTRDLASQPARCGRVLFLLFWE